MRCALRTAARLRADAPLVANGSPLGYPPLRVQLARRLLDVGVSATPQQILLTASGTKALDLVCRLLRRHVWPV